MSRDDARDAIFSLLTDWLPYADALDEKDIQEKTERMLSRLLPQVTTVEELEALPVRSFVIDGDDIGWERGLDGWYQPGINYPKQTRYVADQGPLTVVWQP